MWTRLAANLQSGMKATVTRVIVRPSVVRTRIFSPAAGLCTSRIMAQLSDSKTPLISANIDHIQQKRVEKHVRRFAANTYGQVSASFIEDNLIREGISKRGAKLAGKLIMLFLRSKGVPGAKEGVVSVADVVTAMKHPTVIYDNPEAFNTLTNQYAQVLQDEKGNPVNNNKEVIFAWDLVKFISRELKTSHQFKNISYSEQFSTIVKLTAEWGKTFSKSIVKREDNTKVTVTNPKASIWKVKRPVADVETIKGILDGTLDVTPKLPVNHFSNK